MKFFQVIVAWFKNNFVWSNEDFAFITGGIVTLQQIHFDPTNTVFALAVGSILKGLMSMFTITLGASQSEDIVLAVGGFVSLYQIHFDIYNALFAVIVGAIIKAAFGIFGINLPIPIAQVPPVSTPAQPLAAGMPFTALSDAKAKMEKSTIISRAQYSAIANDPSVVEKGPDWVKLKNGTVLRVDPSKP